MEPKIGNLKNVSSFTYDLSDLDGKTLKIIANRNDDGLLVAGLDIETNAIYILIAEPNVEDKREE